MSELLGGMLGPDGPELTCQECFAELDRYVELRLGVEPELDRYVELRLGVEDADRRVPGMRAHLEGCPACAEDYRSLRDLISRGLSEDDRG